MLQAVTKAGYAEPTAIQARAIPPALAGKDVIGCAQTGTGKTAAFAIPMIERLAGGEGPRALILAPTRELAMQIQKTFELLGKPRGVYATLIVGGADMAQQERALRQRPDVLVATPGRVLDHMWRGTINLLAVQIFVLDEADRLLDMGFAPQINQILDALPEERQTLLFSATMPSDVTALAKTSLNHPVRIEIAPSGTVAARAEQHLFHTSREQKTVLLQRLLKDEPGSTLVFTRTKSRADRLGKVLQADGLPVAVLHGDRTMGQRREALEGFKRGRYRVLVATDIMARGIHVTGIAHVINYDLPNSPEDYVHRIGRTARVEATGRASSFVTPEEKGQLHAIEQLLGTRVPVAKQQLVAG
ncbi:MAG: DEAD/DEAH box helicase [Nitrospirota bacterium]|nr:DEAD/DEAH box helicase [Nitrospirota bacterium]MDE3118699.1 DEAD/DEAH box helicase [Nitrospirota bacterium]MDE3241283.1 DEAD/DEAH box helicase [Nitrospirota bacterium]